MSAVNTQSGIVPLVVGQQSYAVIFPTPFTSAPSSIQVDVQMPNSSGEAFFGTVDASSITVTGFTVWLSGVPSSASVGGNVNWLATGSTPPPVFTSPRTGIRLVTLCSRIARRSRGGDFTRLSLNGKMDLLEAANTAMQRLYNALPVYFKEMTQGFVLPAPLTVSGIGVTQFANTITGYSFSSSQFGQTVVLDGDSAWNQIIGPNLLLNPYMGSTGTVGGIIYGNALYSTTYPFDRVIGDPRLADQNLNAWNQSGLIRSNDSLYWPFQQSVGQPQTWWPQLFGNSQGNEPIMVLRFAPAPDRAYPVNVRMSFWPKRLTLSDYDANTLLPVPDQFIEASLIPMCLEEFMASPEWESRKDEEAVLARGQKGEEFARLQPGQIAAPHNRIYTPLGF